MNELAHFVYRLVHGDRASRTDLSNSERTAVAELHPLLDRDLDDVATWLDGLQTPAEEWLVPPPIVLDQPHP